MVEGSRRISALLATDKLDDDLVVLRIAEQFARGLTEGQSLTIV